MTVESMKKAISNLPPDERHSLAHWLNGLDYDDWDRQMADDFSPDGRGAALVNRVKREIAEGKSTDFEEGLTQTRSRREPSCQ